MGHLGGFKILVISWRVLLYLYFLLTVLEYNCLRVHMLQVLLPQVCQWRGAGKASQARGFSELGLAPKTVGLGAGDLYIFLTWKRAERVRLPRSELIPQPDMEGAPPSCGGRGLGRGTGCCLIQHRAFTLLIRPMALRSLSPRNF